MREILFRGKRVDNREWVCGGSIIRFNKEQGEDCDLVFMPQYDEKCLCTHDANDNIIAWDKTMFYKIDPSTLGQYTGLKDSNGQKIFEGDILLPPGEKDAHIRLVVEFKDYAWKLRWLGSKSSFNHYLSNWDGEIYKVIGNIHDNPGLLLEGVYNNDI